MSKIPVIGTAIVNTPYWLYRLIESIDYPVGELFIVNNNGRGQITKELDDIASIKHEFIDKIKVCHLPGNIGCAGAWNLIIKCYMMQPYWLIVNHDIMFSKGLLEQMYKEAESSSAGVIHAEANEDGYGKWDLFLLKSDVVNRVGLFDENLYPAYSEDFDYIMRLINCEIESSIINMPYLHGEDSYETTGSQTWRSDLSLKEKLASAALFNDHNYMVCKWGILWRDYKPFETPFNLGLDNRYTMYNLNLVKSKNLGF